MYILREMRWLRHTGSLIGISLHTTAVGKYKEALCTEDQSLERAGSGGSRQGSRTVERVP